jgi:hypothetical protein
MNFKKSIIYLLTLTTVFSTGLTFTALSVFAREDSVEIKTGINAEIRNDIDGNHQGSTTLNASSSINKNKEKRQESATTTISNLKARAGQEIKRRIDALNKLNTRVQAMKKVSAQGKASMAAQVQAQITLLTNLKIKIDADTDLTVLRTDIKTITDSYRIYALIIPQGEIYAAADRATSIADDLTTVSGKLQTRITAASALGKDVTALQTSLADLNAKVADARVQIKAALDKISNLTPDLGKDSQFQANKDALSKARTNIRVAKQDLDAANKDTRNIVKGLKDFEPKKNNKDDGENAHGSTTISASSTGER